MVPLPILASGEKTSSIDLSYSPAVFRGGVLPSMEKSRKKGKESTDAHTAVATLEKG